MQVIQKTVKVLLLFFVVLNFFQIGVYADKVDSVEDMFKQPAQSEDGEISEPLNTEETPVEEERSVGLTIWDFLKMIFATLFVLALLYFLLKFINKRSHGYKDSQLIQNIGGTSLGANRSVQMIKVGERVLIVGVGENIQLLKEIEDEEEARQIIEEYNHKMEQLMSPSDIVTKVVKRTRSFQIQNKEKETSSFSSILNDRLEHISKERKKLFDEMEKKESDKR